MVQQGAAALFLDPGLGKTSISLAAIDLFREQKLHRAALVICPLRPAHLVWPNEGRKWTDFQHLRITVLHGSQKNKLLQQPADVYVINPEGLPWLFEALKRYYRRKDWPFDQLYVDESSKFRNTHTQRFHELKPHLARFKRRYILTGTPAPKSLLNLYGQIFLLDQGNALGKFFTHYRDKFFKGTGYGGYEYVPLPRSEQQIYRKLRPLVLRMSAEDYLSLPPITYSNIYVALPDKARKAYDEMERTFFTQLDKGTVTAANMAVVGGKCRQMANGGVFLDGMARTWQHIHTEKCDAVVDLLDELEGQPALIAYEFKHDLERLQRALKKGGYGDVPYFGGGASKQRAAELEREWNAGNLPALLGQPASIAYGLNLQGGRVVIWHSLLWDLELYLQFIQRVWRQGQQNAVFVHHILAQDTVDDAVLGSLAAKNRQQRTLLAALQSYRRSKRA